MLKQLIGFFAPPLLCVAISLLAAPGMSMPNEYQANSTLQWEWAMESLKKFPFGDKDKVLDIGCGDGKITRLIAKQVPGGIVVGLDISDKMLAHANVSFSADNLLFVHASAEDIPFSNQFDKVVSLYTLQWVLRQEEALESIRECLKPGGLALLVFPGKLSTNPGYVAERVMRSKKWSTYFPDVKSHRVYYTEEEYRSLLTLAGFKIKSLEEKEVINTYKNEEAFVGFVRPLINFIDHLPADLKEDFIKDVARGMMEPELMYSDGSIGLRSSKIEAIAYKQ